MKKHYSNEELIQLLNGSIDDQNEAILWIYSKSGWAIIAKRFVRQNGGSREDAFDNVQSGITTLLEEAQNKKLQKVENIKGYFLGTCRNIWLNRFNRRINGREIIDREISKEEPTENEEQKFIKKEQWAELDKILLALGRKCRDVLILWANGYSHEEIALKLGYENANVSKKTKSVCIKKWRDESGGDLLDLLGD